MILQGFIDYKNNNFDHSSGYKEYESEIQLENGFLVEKGFDKLNNAYNSFLIGVSGSSLSKERKILSSFLTQDFSSLEEYLRIPENQTLSIGAWYDRSEDKIYLSREVFSHVPLYYLHVPGDFFAFSTSLVSLVKNKRLRQHISPNVARITSYFEFSKDAVTSYSGDTFYSNIKSVLPGHLMCVTPGEVSTKSYVLFDPYKYSDLSTLVEFGQAFRESFKKAVLRTIGDETRVLSSHLSGGLDSSSVSTMIHHIYPDRPLHTIYHNTNSKDSDESEYAVTVANHIGSRHHQVFQSEEDFTLLKKYVSLCGQPFVANLSPAAIGSLMEYAHNLGCDTVISGISGDLIVGSGLEIVLKLYGEKKWAEVKALLEQTANHFPLTRQFPDWDSFSVEKRRNLILQNFLFNRITKKIGKIPLKNLYQEYREVASQFDISYSYAVKRLFKGLLRKLNKQSGTSHSSILKEEFLHIEKKQSTDLVLSYSLRGNLPVEYQHWFDDVFFEQAIVADEQRFVLGNYYGISNRTPFQNQQLFELCIAIPTLVKFGVGRGREHFREAMKGLLPENVRNRSSKAHMKSYGQTVTLRLFSQAESYLMNSTKVWEFVDKNKFVEETIILKSNTIPSEDKVRTWFFITRTISLAIWLDCLEEYTSE